LQALIRPIHERRLELARDPGYVIDVIRAGTQKAKDLTNQTKSEVIEGLGLFIL
jgi:tryptophanyl-tRNA synthetase